ncbi:MAG: hypothetical protein L6Q54_12880 [Leptospiraceae bacterium]|nr:hypothetical protein [Leptospiraceae bacterium]
MSKAKSIAEIKKQRFISKGPEFLLPGTLRGGEAILPGTLHADCHGASFGSSGIRPLNNQLVPPLPAGGFILPFTLRSPDAGIKYPYSNATYMTKSGKNIFVYRYVLMPGGYYEIDIVSQPSYGLRDSSLVKTHRNECSRPGAAYTICISKGLEPKSIDLAKKISVEFAEITEQYISSLFKSMDDIVKARVSS